MRKFLNKIISAVRKKPPQVVKEERQVVLKIDKKYKTVKTTEKKKRTRKCATVGKTMFNEQAAKKLAKKYSSSHQKLRAYRCQFCNSWHFTKKKSKYKANW